MKCVLQLLHLGELANRGGYGSRYLVAGQVPVNETCEMHDLSMAKGHDKMGPSSPRECDATYKSSR